MTRKNICEHCGKEFLVFRNRQIGRFCSRDCNRRLLRKRVLLKYEKYLESETEEQKLQWLKKHYEKFVIKIKNDCWGWNGSKVHGYGNFNHRGKIMKAHRASWIVHNDPIPNGIFVLHKCDIRHCTNPDHLFLGNQTDNMKDMASKNRTKVRTKLTQSQVYEIKNLLSLGVSMTKLALKFGVSSQSIWQIKSGGSWKHLK